MADKSVQHHRVTIGEDEATLPVGIVTGDADGPTLGVLGGVHGTEYAAQDGVLQFWSRLDPARLRGRVLVALAADPLALTQHSAYVNPVDGKNLNRVWPGNPDGTITEAIAATLTREVVSPSDAVVDVHGGEWDEDIGCFIITHRVGNPDLDERTLALAMAIGFPYVEVTDAHGAVLGTGTGGAEAMKSGRPAMTLEAGGAGRRDPVVVNAFCYGLENAMRHLGIVEGPVARWAGEPVLLDHGVLLKTAQAGLLRPRVRVGEWIEAGEVFTEVVDLDGSRVLEQVRVEEAGTVLDVIIARGVKAGGFVGKIGVPAVGAAPGAPPPP